MREERHKLRIASMQTILEVILEQLVLEVCEGHQSRGISSSLALPNRQASGSI